MRMISASNEILFHAQHSILIAFHEQNRLNLAPSSQKSYFYASYYFSMLSSVNLRKNIVSENILFDYTSISKAICFN